MKQARNSKGKKRTGRRGNPASGNAMTLPPFIPTIQTSHRFRFVNGANGGSFSISDVMLFRLLEVAATATTAFNIIQAWRLKRVEIWSNPPALGAPPTTCSVEWNGDNAPSIAVSDTTMGVRPAHVSCRPPPQSLAQWWHASGLDVDATTQFSLFLPIDSVVDVVLDLRFKDTEAPTAGEAPGAATAGQLYGNYLDSKASGKLLPVGYTVLP